MKKRFAMLTLCFVFVACGKGKGKGGGGGSGTSNLAIVLTKNSSLLSTQSAGTSCEARDNSSTGAPATGESGYCFTPINIKGTVSEMMLGSTFGGVGARILGGGTAVGLDTIFGFNKFNLLTATAFAGDDNIQDAGAATLNTATLYYYHLESIFHVAGEIWHVRYFFYNSTPSAAAPFLGCAVGTSELAHLDEKASSGVPNVAFKKYDVMSCVEGTGEDCSDDTHFKWIDTSDTTNYPLTATRPTGALQLVDRAGTGAPSTIFGKDDACAQGAEHPEYEVSGVDLFFNVSSAISGLSAKFDSGKKIYTYGGSSGNKLTATLAFDLTNFMYWPTELSIGTDLDTVTSDAYKAIIRGKLNKILPRGLYVKSRLSSRSVTYAASHNVAVSLAVTTE